MMRMLVANRLGNCTHSMNKFSKEGLKKTSRIW